MKNRCYVCGETAILNHHHIIRRADGGSNKKINLIVLCPNCHSAAHKGWLDTDYLFELKEIVESGKSILQQHKKLNPRTNLEMLYPNLSIIEIAALQAHERFSPVDRLGLK